MVRGRGELTPKDIEIRKLISNNINNLLAKHNKKQIDLHTGTGIPKSTLTGYVKGTSTPNQGNIQKIADFFGVKKSVIDPRFSSELNPNSASIFPIERIYSKLEPPRQEKVYDFAKTQLEEQQLKNKTSSESVVQFPVSESTDQYDTDNELQEVGLNLDVAAGYGSVNYDKTQIIDTVFVRRKDIPSIYDLVARINGDSMKPTFEDNEIIFIKQTSEINNGMIAALEINDLAYLKKVYMENGRMRIVSLNDEVDQYGERIYPDFYADEHDEIYIIGRVVM